MYVTTTDTSLIQVLLTSCLMSTRPVPVNAKASEIQWIKQ